MPSKYFVMDGATGLIKREVGLSALTADAYVGTQHDQGGNVATDMACIINIESCKVSAGDEVYRFRIVGSLTSDRSDAEVLAELEVGDAGTLAIETRDCIAGDQLIIRFRTEKNDQEFRYIDLHLDVTGTSPSIGFGAYLSKEM